MRWRYLVLVIASVLCASGAIGASSAIACTDRKSSEDKRTVTEIVDAETLALDDGSEVRLIGALAPKRPLNFTSRSAWLPERQAVAALTEIALGKTVELIAAGRPSDRYGHRLVHVVVIGADGARIWIQGALLERGLARAYALPGSSHCMTEMLARESHAREAKLGLWAHGAYAVRRASRPSELMKARSTYQIVEGRIASVATVRGAVYLNFGTDWRRDFTAGYLKRFKTREQAAMPVDLLELKGKNVRVRGWIERRNGPFIEIVNAGQIEVLDKPPQSAPPIAASTSASSTEPK